MSWDCAFEEDLPTQGTIGKLTSQVVGGDIVTAWATAYETKADIQTIKGSERFMSDAVKIVATHRIFMPIHDLKGVEMVLNETYEFIEAVPFDYETQKNLTRYRFTLVDRLGDHHYEVLAERVSPGG